MEKILLTGTTGFIGKELISALLKNGYEVHALERYVTGRYSIDGNGEVTRHYASLTDYPAVSNIVREVQPDCCINLAAISAVSFSYEHYVEAGETNYIGTTNLAESCKRHVPGFRQFIMAGTSEEYGMALNSTEGRLNEQSPLLPNSPYAVAKVAADMYLRYMGMAYGFPFTILRPFNTYGRTDNTHFFCGENDIADAQAADSPSWRS